ncbi:MAG TPA: phenylacetate--CoA ligase family protein [Acidimicrobiia bacterium]|nr:phenylacetate--CoA ligase family protein [Acidimicrobiia bacterium]
MTALPPPSARFFDEAVETMPRGALRDHQEALLLELLPHAYEHAPLVRHAWDAAGVHPRDVRDLDDFCALAPFVSKDAIRRYRDGSTDPFGGVLAVPLAELTAVMSTSGTTGDPTLVPEQWGRGRGPAALSRDFWGMGVRPGDHVALVLFTFRGPTYGFVQGMGGIPVLFDFDPAEMERFCEASLEYRPTGLYNFGSALIRAVADACDRRGFDPVDVFSSYRGVVFAGEPLGRRSRELAEAWGIELFEHTGVGDVTYAFECGEHDGLHFWEDTVFVECLTPDGDEPVADGGRGELVATTLFNRVAPFVRFRSDDLVRVTRAPCACGRTHARLWPIGRKSDEVVVDGRSVLPVDVWDAIESVDASAAGLFQVVRSSTTADRLQLRVGYAPQFATRLDAVADEVRDAVVAAVGVDVAVELVPDDALLRLGPPHKIPRVAGA